MLFTERANLTQLINFSVTLDSDDLMFPSLNLKLSLQIGNSTDRDQAICQAFYEGEILIEPL